MIKLHGFICALACVFLFSGCGDDSEYSYSYQDMISFLLDEPVMEGYVESVTRLDAAPDSRVALLVSRNISLMERYPKQTVQVVVDDALSTAVEGTDFDFTPRSLESVKVRSSCPSRSISTVRRAKRLSCSWYTGITTNVRSRRA